jgi:hypothetical protein
VKRLLHGNHGLQWPCQGIFQGAGQFQGTGKGEGGPGPGQACGLTWSLQDPVTVPLGPFKKILSLKIPGEGPVTAPLELL